MRHIKLGEVCDIIVGRTPPRADPSTWGGDAPWVSIADMNQGLSITSTKERISTAGAAKGRLIPAGTVLLSFKLSIGKVARAGMPLYTNEAIAALPVRDPGKVDAAYLLRALQAQDLTGGSNRAAMGSTLNKAALQAITVPLPPLGEQRRIAAILDQADAIRTKRRQVLAQLSGLKSSRFSEVARQQGGEYTPLGDLLDFLTSGSRGWAKHYSETGDPFIRIQNVGGGTLDLTDIAYVQAPDTAEARRTLVRSGDVLVSITADLGRTAVIPPELGRGYVNQHMAILRAPDLVPEFLAHYLESAEGRRQLMKKNRGQVKAGLNFDDIRSVEVPTTAREVQQEFADFCHLVDQQLEAAKAVQTQDDDLFASLQARAFRGEL